MTTVFLRVLEELHDKESALRDAIDARKEACGHRRFEVDPQSFLVVQGSPFAYWVSDRLRALFSALSPFEAEGRQAQLGLSTKNDFRYLRTSWERLGDQASHRPASGWLPFAKGGAFSPYYADIHLLVNWIDEGREIEAELIDKYLYLKGNAEWVLHREYNYLRPGLTWTRRTKRNLSLRVMPAGCIFGDKGPAVVLKDNDHGELLCLLAVGNSQAFRSLVEFQLAAADASAGGAARSYEVGVIQRTPLPRLAGPSHRALAQLTTSSWVLRRSLDTIMETSRAFTLPALLQVAGPDLATRTAAWRERVCGSDVELAAIQAKIDELCFEVYGINEADRRTITDGFGISASEKASGDGGEDTEDDAEEDIDENESIADARSLAAELVSWAVGVVFGRFDVRLATGARPLPSEPKPFDPLPACSFGRLTGDDGLPHVRPPAGYPLAFPESGVLVDDPGHAQDLTDTVRAVFDVVFGVSADRWWENVAALLDPKSYDLRSWLAGSFFEHHLKRHSKSRRKAPIVWQLGTPSARYSVWLYAHRLTRDSFFQLQNEVVGQKLIHEERQLASLMQTAGGSPSASERKVIAGQGAFIEELRAMIDEVKRIAPLWNPDLDDGVVLTMAPLWRLVPQHKPWQKALKGKWGELAAGKYDWAHLAMHLWPERVVPKCATDRSLAIAHGLEDVFWILDFRSQWRALDGPQKEHDYVQDYWAGSVRHALVTLARDLWQSGYRDTGRDDRHWFEETEQGLNDEHPIALRLWPRRVCEQAIARESVAMAHGLKPPPKLAHMNPELAATQRDKWLHLMSSRFGVKQDDRDFLRATFGSPEPLSGWREWWEQLDGGALDDLAVARYARPAEVAERCHTTVELARAHEVVGYFFVDTGGGLRARLEPKGEIFREVSEKTSSAVKAALRNFVDAPGIASGTRRTRDRRRGASTTAAGRSR